MPKNTALRIMNPDAPSDGSQSEPHPATPESEESLVAAEVEEVLRLDQYSEYLLHSPREILAVLRQVATQGDLVTVYFNSGKDFLLTTLLEADEKGVIFEYGSNDEMNRRAIEAGKLFCITRHAKVKLQFILTGLSTTVHQERAAFAAPLPETLLRLQRREYFRLTLPITRPLSCEIPATMSDGSMQNHVHAVLDLSIGGLSLQLGEILLEAGQVVSDCRLELPNIGTLDITLNVLNNYELTLRNGQRSLRVGCQFVDLPQSAQNMIQRYIVRSERERKARESGLA